MAQTPNREAVPWEKAERLLQDFDRREQEQRQRGLETALAEASASSGEAVRKIQSASGALGEGDLLEVADAGTVAFAQIGKFDAIIKFIRTVTSLGLANDRKAQVMRWDRARPLLRDFDRQAQEDRLRKIGIALGATKGALGDVQAQIQSARMLAESDLLDVADAGNEAAKRLRRLQAITKLIGDITSAKYSLGAGFDGHYQEFERLLNSEYKQLALEDEYPAEAEAYAKLDEVLERMGEIRLAPRLASRNICAVAGGFSSGKSSFLNSLISELDTDDLLPTRITPTTSIPTFIFNIKDAESVNVFNYRGGSVKVERGVLQEMTHDFKAEYGIELKRLVARVSIYTQELAKWSNVAFIDTPGYTNPDDGSGATSDEEIALRSICQSQFLVWLVDCGRGTLVERDVQLIRMFLQQRSPSDNEVIYLVLNKAEKLREEQRESVLKQVVEVVKAKDIPCFGVALYSAHQREWYGSEGRSFDEFLEEVNGAEAVNIETLREDVEQVFVRYAEYHADERKRLQRTLGLMNRLSLAGNAPESSNLEQGLNEYQGRLKTEIENHKKWAERGDVLKDKLLRSVDGFVDEVNSMRDSL